MKKIFFAALFAITIFTSAFAADNKKVSTRILNNFTTDYAMATDVSWTVRSNFAKATFNLDGKAIEAFYDLNGNAIGMSSKITLDVLPVSAKRSIAKKFAGYNVIEAIKFEGIDETAYYISTENENEKLIVKVGQDASVSIFQKTRKK